MFGFFKKSPIEKRLEMALSAIDELKSLPAEVKTVYHEITHYSDADTSHIRELAQMAANEHLRSFFYFEREKLVNRLESLEPEQEAIRAGVHAALKQMSILQKRLEAFVLVYAELNKAGQA